MDLITKTRGAPGDQAASSTSVKSTSFSSGSNGSGR
jgi:hypothetical protein